MADSENWPGNTVVFEEAYRLTGLNCIVKVHCLFRHVKTFIDEFLPQGAGIGAVSEQAFEYFHSKFKKAWAQQYQCDQDSPAYSKYLYWAVCDQMYCNYIP